MGSLLGRLAQSSRNRNYSSEDERLFYEVCELMNEIERGAYEKHKPLELPIRWLYHISLCILTIIVLIPVQIFTCNCKGERKACSEDCLVQLSEKDCCAYCFQFDKLHEEELDMSYDTAQVDNNQRIVGAAIAEDTKKAMKTLDTAIPIPTGGVAREALQPGLYFMLLRILEHHDYFQKAYASMLPVVLWNIVAPFWTCNCESLVTYLSEDHYFTPLERPVRPEMQTRSDDCCEDLCNMFQESMSDSCSAACNLVLCGCCIKAFCEHEMVHCKTYSEIYEYRLDQNQAKTNSEITNEFMKDRASAVGIGRRNPDAFVRSLFVAFTGFKSCQPAQTCGPACISLYRSYSEKAQEFHNDLQERSIEATRSFYMEHFGVATFEELLEREGNTSKGKTRNVDEQIGQPSQNELRTNNILRAMGRLIAPVVEKINR